MWLLRTQEDLSQLGITLVEELMRRLNSVINGLRARGLQELPQGVIEGLLQRRASQVEELESQTIGEQAMPVMGTSTDDYRPSIWLGDT